MSVKGSCLCGAIQFEITETPRGATHCHCSRCRKARGTGHATNFFVAATALRFLKGEDQLGKYKLPEAKFFSHWFCRACGSPMPRHDKDRNIAIVPMGSLDEDPGVRPGRHIHVASKAPWDTIADELPQFEAGPPQL